MELFRLAKEKGLEGIIAKRKSSGVYRPGKRSPDWLKIKSRPQQEFVVCGFTEGKGSRKHLGALLLGAYRNGRLRYFGHSGTGFSEKGLKEAIDRLKPLFTGKPPVENPPEIPEKIQWVQPNTQQGFMELFAGSMIGLTCTGTRAPSTPWVEDSWRRGGSGASSETPQFGMGPKGGVHYTRNLAVFGLGYETNLGVRTKATGS